MASICVVYESRHGYTARLADYVAAMAGRRGHDVKVVHASLAIGMDLSAHDAIVVLGPVYFGRHRPSIEAFLKRRADVLSDRPSAFLSVCGAAASPLLEARARAERLARDTVAASGARPRLVATVGGAIAYPRYPFYVRWMTKLAARRDGGPTDTSRTHELTDWDALDHAMAGFFGLFPPVNIAAHGHP